MSDAANDHKVTDSKVHEPKLPEPKSPEPKLPEPKLTGTPGASNPKTGSSDAARGLGGHSKDANYATGSPAEYVEESKTVRKG